MLTMPLKIVPVFDGSMALMVAAMSEKRFAEVW
jgi:hypothetical protein